MYTPKPSGATVSTSTGGKAKARVQKCRCQELDQGTCQETGSCVSGAQGHAGRPRHLVRCWPLPVGATVRFCLVSQSGVGVAVFLQELKPQLYRLQSQPGTCLKFPKKFPIDIRKENSLVVD